MIDMYPGHTRKNGDEETTRSNTDSHLWSSRNTFAFIPLQCDFVPRVSIVFPVRGQGQDTWTQVKVQSDMSLHKLNGQEVSLERKGVE